MSLRITTRKMSRITSVAESSYPWFDIAIQEIGTKEIQGGGDGQCVVEYLRSTSLGHADNANDGTPWCAAFVNWCVEKSENAGTDSASALN